MIKLIELKHYNFNMILEGWNSDKLIFHKHKIDLKNYFIKTKE